MSACSERSHSVTLYEPSLAARCLQTDQIACKVCPIDGGSFKHCVADRQADAMLLILPQVGSGK